MGVKSLYIVANLLACMNFLYNKQGLTSMSSLVNNERWAPLIGRLFIAFGILENATHECIRQWAGDIVYRHAKKRPFAERIELTMDLANTQSFSEKCKSDFIENLKTVADINKIRNTIAHSPLSLVLFSGESTAAFIEAISDNVKPRYIEFAELKLKVEQAESSAQKVHQHLAEFRGAQVRHIYGGFDGTCDDV